jgi:hypothetical protein
MRNLTLLPVGKASRDSAWEPMDTANEYGMSAEAWAITQFHHGHYFAVGVRDLADPDLRVAILAIRGSAAEGLPRCGS